MHASGIYLITYDFTFFIHLFHLLFLFLLICAKTRSEISPPPGNTLLLSVLKMLFISSSSSSTICSIWSITSYIFSIIITSVISLIKTSSPTLFKSRDIQICFSDDEKQEAAWRLWVCISISIVCNFLFK